MEDCTIDGSGRQKKSTRSSPDRPDKASTVARHRDPPSVEQRPGHPTEALAAGTLAIAMRMPANLPAC